MEIIPYEGCDGVPNSGFVNDECGVCNGDNSTCTDECGIVNGDNSTCEGCDGVPNSGFVNDECGVCNGDNSTCTDGGIVNGDNSTCTDECGIVNGDNSTCEGCDGVPNSGLVLDECGVCGGDGLDVDEDGICDDIDECIEDCGGSCYNENVELWGWCYNIIETTILNPEVVSSSFTNGQVIPQK